MIWSMDSSSNESTVYATYGNGIQKRLYCTNLVIVTRIHVVVVNNLSLFEFLLYRNIYLILASYLID